MSHSYIARQAILDRQHQTVGYELLFRDSERNQFPEIDPDMATAKLIIQNHLHGDIVDLSMGKPAFINFTEQCLIHKYPLMFAPESIVIELDGITKITSKLVKIAEYYQQKGYCIALTHFDLTDNWQILLPFISMIKIDIEQHNPKQLFTIQEQIKAFDILLIAEKVETRLQQQSLAEIGFDFYQGYFYHQPEIIEGQQLTPMKQQMLQLISEANKTTLCFDEIANIIAKDVNLTIGLLKLVNNLATGTKVEISSIKQATAYLGEQQLRQFITVLAMSKIMTAQTNEACKQALIIAKVMEQLATHEHFKAVANYAFITGLLSNIDCLMAQPLESIVTHMALSTPIEQALLTEQGLLGELLHHVKCHVQGESNAASLTVIGLEQAQIQQEFINASNWCQQLFAA